MLNVIFIRHIESDSRVQILIPGTCEKAYSRYNDLKHTYIAARS